MSEHANSLHFTERCSGFLREYVDLEGPDSYQSEEAKVTAEHQLRPPSPIVLIEAATPPIKLEHEQIKLLKPMSRKQKQTLANHIHALAPQYISHITDLVRGHRRPSAGNRFEFDLDTLPLDLCYELKQYVSKCRRQRNKKVLVLLSDSESSSSWEE